jgi:hypothetical protein
MAGFDSVKRLLAFAFLLTGVLYLMLFHLTQNALSSFTAQTGNPFSHTQEEIQSALVGQQNILLVLGDPPAAAVNDAKPFMRAYYTAVYLHYPHRVFVGQDNRIVNFENDLLGADALPSPDWMHTHQVSELFVFFGGDQAKHLRVFQLQ